MRKIRIHDRVSGRRVMRMPNLKPQARANKYERDQSYIKNNLAFVNVSFNRRKPEDMILYDWLNQQGESKVKYIKKLILEDMEKSGK